MASGAYPGGCGLLTPWKYGGVSCHSMFWPPPQKKKSHSFIPNCCWINLQVLHHQGWKMCIKNGRYKNSAIADRWQTARRIYANNGVVELLNMPLPRVTIPNLVIVRFDVGINSGESPKLGNAGTSLSWDGRRGRPHTCRSPTCVTTSNLVVLRQKVYALIEGNPQNWGVLWPRPLAVGALMTPKIHLFPSIPCQIWSFYVKRYERY